MDFYGLHCIAGSREKFHAEDMAKKASASAIVLVLLTFAGTFVAAGVTTLAWHLLRFGKAF
jgi:hypothetical protein